MPTELRLLKKVICPYCWTEFLPENVLWVSEHEELVITLKGMVHEVL